MVGDQVSVERWHAGAQRGLLSALHVERDTGNMKRVAMQD